MIFFDSAHYNSIMSKIKKFWHPANPGIPEDYKPQSNKKLLWQCPVAKDHQWTTAVSKITGGGGCPFCVGRKIAVSNSLATTHPSIAAEWNVKNELKPDQVGYGQGKRVWWKCKHGHEWQCTINSRTNFQSGCPYCANQRVSPDNSLYQTHPNLSKEWSSKNDFQPTEISSGSNKKIWWKCSHDHEWLASPNNRSKGRGCPYCGNKKVCLGNSLQVNFPELSQEWHPTKNSIKPEEILPGSGQKIWWQCKKGHEWIAAVCQRTGPRKTGCPFCLESRGEAKIVKLLLEMKIDYERQAKFPGCKNKIPLRFDFAILPDRKLLIEYNGIQHYKETSCFGGKKGLAAVRKNDKIKADFCKKHGLKLIVISYRNYSNIETILKSVFNG